MRYPETPPERLSDLIDLVAADARRLDRTTYTPGASVWLQPADDGCCMICLAGSVITGSPATWSNGLHTLGLQAPPRPAAGRRTLR